MKKHLWKKPEQEENRMKSLVVPRGNESDRKRYLKMLEQGVILAAIIISIIVVMAFLEDILPENYMMIMNVIRLLIIIVLIGGLAYIAVTGLHEMRTG